MVSQLFVGGKLMKLVLGCDDAGQPLMDVIRDYLKEHPEVDVTDFGWNDKDGEYYPDVAERVSVAIAEGDFERGILICGTGLGMAITANKIPGIRAATCHDTYSAERARKSNDAQVLTMGSRVIGPEHAKKVVDAWLASEFAGGGSAPKVQRMIEIEARHMGKKDVK
jgi:ribose 5-phosphate isomerase B